MNQVAHEKHSNIQRALDYLRDNRPLRAEEVCRDFLNRNPGCTDHIRLLSLALMKQNRATKAEEQLRFALSLDPDFPQLYEDLGSALAMQSKFEEAISEFEKAIRLQPSLPLAHKKLGQALAAIGKGSEADDAFQEYVANDPERSAIVKGVEFRQGGKNDEAIKAFRKVLKENPQNVNAMRHLAVSYWHGEKRLEDAEALLRRATQITPQFSGAWQTLGALLMEMNKYLDAITAYTKATELEEKNADAWAGLGNAHARAMNPEEAARAFERSIAIDGDAPGILSAYGWELKTLGNQAEALKAYRRAIKVRPRYGPAYWNMANLKIFKFENKEIETMLEQVKREDLSENEDIHFRFSLGKAMEDKKDYDQAWHFYHTGNQQQRMTVEYEMVEFENRLNAIKNVFNATLLTDRSDIGYEAPDPIFIVGLPRSGSTLVEQILASHSQVEGTAELPVLGKIAESIGRYRKGGNRYPEAVTKLRNKDLRAYGKQYIEESQRYRTTEKPFFTDKLPNNFPLMGFAHLILPNAKVINARRHPFDTCLGAYKQLFGQGQNFTYDMLELAHYYRQYDALMKHWHEVLPGKILDVHYEETVTDLENQVKQILEHCGLPFEESCVHFHETERAVKTASSEQVRQPIYTGALGKWRRYDKHLSLWKEYLSYIVDDLPAASRNAGL
ncbi:MAG: sulfotransferase [Woeseia sp.]|nr:sulfotransferase [Woeseia sp.]|tara:strand:+ start:2714 stop:4732 length:2019 start_codon:yes stop_codon:yes gene_type:complete